MDYPNIAITATSANGENDASVTLTIGGTLTVDEAALIDVVTNYLLGLPGLTTARAVKRSIAEQDV
ncbi:MULTISPECIES: hypothetical protein [Streptomyces]|uniref:Uncharacterized protein n=1 Tax=Streptomyces dengpaensis TaxID=2049881 RepID=A0ABM6SZJ9_9ACTN|nr:MULTISPECIES: hypothetical protein [Streptomyces]AVH60016.1 hypothetical protein C4B68_34260 [Streptomyces dengpaensis]PIB09654.1 hypothetical protein B1C81_10935 [Streptomyces sp. HG99]